MEKSSDTPIGQWNGNKGFVLNSEYVTSEPIPLNKVLIFEYDPHIKKFKWKDLIYK